MGKDVHQPKYYQSTELTGCPVVEIDEIEKEEKEQEERYKQWKKVRKSLR